MDKIKFEYFTANRVEIVTRGISPRSGVSTVLFISTEKRKLIGEDQSDAEASFTFVVAPQGNFGNSIVVDGKEFFDTVSSGTALYATMRILAHYGMKFGSYFDPIRNKVIYTSAGPISEILETTIP